MIKVGDIVYDKQGRIGKVISINIDNFVIFEICKGIRNITHLSNLTIKR